MNIPSNYNEYHAVYLINLPVTGSHFDSSVNVLFTVKILNDLSEVSFGKISVRTASLTKRLQHFANTVSSVQDWLERHFSYFINWHF